MATMSYEDWMRSQGFTYDPSKVGASAGRGQVYSGWGKPTAGGRGITTTNQYTTSGLDALGFPARYQNYQTQAENPRVSYSGQAYDPFAAPTASGQYGLYSQGEDGARNLYYDTGTGQLFYAGDETYVAASTGGDDPRSMYASGYRDLEEPAEQPFNSYADAKDVYSGGYIPWNIDNVHEGLSNRQAFNLNALWGGTQYAQGRVTDWSHLDPTQYKANVIAANTRNELWNEYEALKAQGKTPAKNPDEVALDFYVKNVGPNGNTFGYGPGANTALITEAVKHQFLNSPDVVQARGSTYQTPQEKMADIDAFGTAHQAGVPTWQVFEKQQYGSGFNIGSLIPMIIGGMALGPLAGAFGGGLAGNALAGALIGGTTAEIGGGDFMKGALTGGVGAGLTGGLSGISSTLVEYGLSQPIADAVAKAATTAIKVGATGGDIEQAIIGSLVNSGVGGAVSEGLSGAEISPDLVKTISNIATPVISTAIQGGDVEGALTNSLIKGGLSAVKDASWGVNEQPSQDIGDMIGSETPFDLDDAEIGAGVDLTGGTGMPIEIPDFSGGLDAVDDSFDPLPLGYESREQVAAENPDLYLGGVLPQEGEMTVYNPDGSVEYIPQTGVGVYNPSGTTSGSTAGGSGATSGGIPTAATSAAQQAAGVNYGALMDKISGILNPQQPKYDSPIKPYLQPSLLSTGQPMQQKGKDYSQIIGELSSVLAKRGYKVGGKVRTEDNPVEYVSGPEDRYYARHMKRGFAVNGPGTGQSDDIPTMLADGEYVIDADTVAALGDGSSKAGAAALDKFRENIRAHKRSAPTDKIPPKAKSPLEYLKTAKKPKGSKHG